MQPAEQYLVTPQTSDQLTRDAASMVDTEHESVRQLEVRRARYYVTPRLLPILMYGLISVIGLVAINFDTIVQGVNQNLAFDNTLAQSIQMQLSLYTDNRIVGTVTLVMFWGMVGLGAYTLFWLVMAFITAARNELIVETAFSNRGHFWEKVKVPMIKLTFLGCIVGYSLLLIRVLFPIISEIFTRGVMNVFAGSVPIACLEFTVAIFGLILAIHTLVVLLQIFRHADAIF